ncbi:MAG: DUF5719 family protein [Pedococcus sp.]
MNPLVSGIARATLASAAGVGIVLGAAHVQGALAVGPGPAVAGAPRAATDAVRGSAVVCPGPELEGVPGVDDLQVRPRLAAAAAPLRTLAGTTPSSTPGSLSVTRLPGATAAKPVTERAANATTDLNTPAGALVTATQSLAPGLAAAQSWLVPGGERRALTSAPCTPAVAESWILAGGGAPGRQERLVLTNPGGNPVTVDVTLHGADGVVVTSQGKGIVVPARGRTAFLLDSISGDLTTPVVHVVAEGGVVTAVVNDLWLDGTRPAGSDDAVAAATPSRDQVVPAVQVDGAAVLRVAVPGGSEAVVQARVLTPLGPRALPTGGVTRIDGGQVRDIDISKLPQDAVALQVRADVPVVAGAMVTRGVAPASSDFAWSSSTPPLTGVAGMPLVDPAGAAEPLTRSLALTSTGAKAGVEVVTVDARGDQKSLRLNLAQDATLAVNVTGARSVWVTRTSGTGELRAGVVSTLTDKVGTLVTTTPLRDTALRTTTMGLREVQR